MPAHGRYTKHDNMIVFRDKTWCPQDRHVNRKNPCYLVRTHLHIMRTGAPCSPRALAAWLTSLSFDLPPAFPVSLERYEGYSCQLPSSNQQATGLTATALLLPAPRSPHKFEGYIPCTTSPPICVTPVALLSCSLAVNQPTFASHAEAAKARDMAQQEPAPMDRYSHLRASMVSGNRVVPKICNLGFEICYSPRIQIPCEGHVYLGKPPPQGSCLLGE